MCEITLMDREQVLATLRNHESELRRAGIVRLSIFGSTARGDQRPHSDVDLLAEFDGKLPLSLIDILKIENQIGDLLGQPVDLIEEGCLKPHIEKDLMPLKESVHKALLRLRVSPS